MARDRGEMGQVVPLPRARAALPAEVEALLALLRTISDPQLRRYCLDQIGAATTGAEVADALALTQALGQRHQAAALPRAAAAGGAGSGDRRAAGPVAVLRPAAGVAPADSAGIGQDPGAASRAGLRHARKRKVRCIATSSSP